MHLLLLHLLHGLGLLGRRLLDLGGVVLLLVVVVRADGLLRRAVVGGDGLARGVVREHHLLALVLVLLLLEQLDGVVVQLAVRRQLLDAELDLPLRKCSREW